MWKKNPLNFLCLKEKRNSHLKHDFFHKRPKIYRVLSGTRNNRSRIKRVFFALTSWEMFKGSEKIRILRGWRINRVRLYINKFATFSKDLMFLYRVNTLINRTF